MKRFGVISCNDQEEWGSSEARVSSMVNYYRANSDDQWIGFHACRGEIPNVQDIQMFNGFVITGSTKSVNEDDEWILKLLEFIQRAGELNNNVKLPKVVGICFGHQLIAKALGGKVGLNPGNDYVLQSEEIKTSNDADKSAWIKGLFENGTSLRAVQSHGECIIELPKGAISLATSSTCKHEIVQFNSNMLGLQCHPNVLPNEIESIALPSISRSYNWDSEQVKKAADSFKMKCNHERINQYISEFLND